MKKIFGLFLIIILVKAVAWAVVLPIWQTPDEQAHFAQLQWYAEQKNTNVGPVNLSQELVISEELLGTKRDIAGNNKYTYHPEYKNPIIGGLWDRKLKEFNLPVSTRTNYVATEAAMYPPLYYQLATPFYNIVYKNSLIDRVFAARIVSLLSYLLMVVATYFVGKTIWKEKHKVLVLTTLVAFHPMVSFVAAGIHPDNLLNLLYTLVLLLCLLVLKNGIKLKYLIALAICMFAGYNTKVLMLLVGPVIGAVLSYKFFKNKVVGCFIAASILLAPVLVFVFQINLKFVPIVTPNSPLYRMNLVEYLKFRIPKMMFEVWPWYWGVFKWLSLTLPPMVLKIITRIAALAVIGLVIRFWLKIKNKKFDFEFKAVTLFIISSASYIVYLLLWDWRLMQSLGFSQGIQGRYFFPNIAAHMAIFVFGLSWGKFSKPALLIVSGLMILLNFIVLRLLYLSYY